MESLSNCILNYSELINVKNSGNLKSKKYGIIFMPKIIIDNSIFDLKKSEGYTPRSFELSIFENEYIFARKKDISLFTNLSIRHKLKRKMTNKFRH